MVKFLGLTLVCLSAICSAHAPHILSTAHAQESALLNARARDGEIKARAHVPAQEEPDAPEKVIWTGESDGFVINWTTKNLFARPKGNAGAESFSVRPIVEREWKEIEQDRSKRIREGETLVDFEYDRSIEVLSVVGPIVSISDNSGCDCGGAHPSIAIVYRALDLSRPGEVDLSYEGYKKHGKMVQLTDYFPDADIFRALLADSLIQKAFKSSGQRRPANLSALMKAIYLQPVPVGECAYELSDDLLTRFAFHHLENGQVAVRLGLTHAYETCRGRSTEIGILLPIPASLKQQLAQAQSGTAGFLMKDAKKIAREQMTSLSFKTH
ncbi:MAG TPA: hypothetical protein VGO91_20490 [Pyrinomonadaceae bacterium]|jgi:hypothetical protein|nr:hypothetical protein [Pyrinomonadaceae bacterium]